MVLSALMLSGVVDAFATLSVNPPCSRVLANVTSGHRYYSPSLGRWISRDPVEEQGGINLYGFVGNNAITGFDLLGLEMLTVTFSDKMAKKYGKRDLYVPRKTCKWCC